MGQNQSSNNSISQQSEIPKDNTPIKGENLQSIISPTGSRTKIQKSLPSTPPVFFHPAPDRNNRFALNTTGAKTMKREPETLVNKSETTPLAKAYSTTKLAAKPIDLLDNSADFDMGDLEENPSAIKKNIKSKSRFDDENFEKNHPIENQGISYISEMDVTIPKPKFEDRIGEQTREISMISNKSLTYSQSTKSLVHLGGISNRDVSMNNGLKRVHERPDLQSRDLDNRNNRYLQQEFEVIKLKETPYNAYEGQSKTYGNNDEVKILDSDRSHSRVITNQSGFENSPSVKRSYLNHNAYVNKANKYDDRMLEMEIKKPNSPRLKLDDDIDHYQEEHTQAYSTKNNRKNIYSPYIEDSPIGTPDHRDSDAHFLRDEDYERNLYGNKHGRIDEVQFSFEPNNYNKTNNDYEKIVKKASPKQEKEKNGKLKYKIAKKNLFLINPESERADTHNSSDSAGSSRPSKRSTNTVYTKKSNQKSLSKSKNTKSKTPEPDLYQTPLDSHNRSQTPVNMQTQGSEWGTLNRSHSYYHQYHPSLDSRIPYNQPPPNYQVVQQPVYYNPLISPPAQVTPINMLPPYTIIQQPQVIYPAYNPQPIYGPYSAITSPTNYIAANSLNYGPPMSTLQSQQQQRYDTIQSFPSYYNIGKENTFTEGMYENHKIFNTTIDSRQDEKHLGFTSANHSRKTSLNQTQSQYASNTKLAAIVSKKSFNTQRSKSKKKNHQREDSLNLNQNSFLNDEDIKGIKSALEDTMVTQKPGYKSPPVEFDSKNTSQADINFDPVIQSKSIKLTSSKKETKETKESDSSVVIRNSESILEQKSVTPIATIGKKAERIDIIWDSPRSKSIPPKAKKAESKKLAPSKSSIIQRDLTPEEQSFQNTQTLDITNKSNIVEASINSQPQTYQKGIKLEFNIDENESKTDQKKSLAEIFEQKKKDMISRLESSKKNSTAENAFKKVDKNELFQKRKEMMKTRHQDKLNISDIPSTINSDVALTPNMKSRIANLSPISRDLNNSSISWNNQNKLNTSGLDKKSKEPKPELLERLANGTKTKISKKEMFELTNKKYETLPEVKKKREEEKKKEQRNDELRKRQDKVKQLDEKLRRNLSAKRK